MSVVMKRFSVFAFAAGLAVLAGCGTTPASQPGASTTPAPVSSTPVPAATPVPSGSAPSPAPGSQTPTSQTPACPQPGVYLTAVRAAKHDGFDRVVFEFSGGLPAYQASVVPAVYSDAKGDLVPLAGQVRLRVVFRGASAWCPQPARKTYAGPSVLTPFYPRLLVVSAAGDFEQVLSFGIGVAAAGAYHAHTLTGPDRVVIDFSHVQLGKFPGIWDITSWRQYWGLHYSWSNGHQPWRSAPAMVVEAWARAHWDTEPVVRQVDANTFKVTEPSGKTDTVTGVRPITVPGPWVITRIGYGTGQA